MGVVLTQPGEGSVLVRLGIGVQALDNLGIGIWTRAIPRPGAGVTFPTQYYIPDSLDIEVLEGWGLTFDQTLSIMPPLWDSPDTCLASVAFLS